MAKQCETMEHTADVGLKATADSLPELLEALGEGLADLMCPRDQVIARETRSVNVESPDAGYLAVDFLAKLLVLGQTEKFCIRSIHVEHADEAHAIAIVHGEPCDFDRHELGPEIKAVTYHMLDIRQLQGRWHGMVVFDL